MSFLSRLFAENEAELYGNINAHRPIPTEYTHYRTSKEFLDREERAKKNYFTIGEKGKYGQHWKIGPWHLENYYGDNEPMLDKEGPFRMVVWQPITLKEKPKGWFRLRVGVAIQRTGFVDLKDGVNPGLWTNHAQRHLKKWLKSQDEWEIFEPTLEEFITAYRKSPKDIILKLMFIDILKKEIKAHKKNVRMFCGRKKETGEIEAGFVALDIPEVKQSLHLISFLHNSAKDSPLGYGLINYWFNSIIEKGFRFADFGIFWKKGDPRSWRGYSRFKSQFGTQFVDYPKPLVRWTGRLFDF
jgi:hypothetical protein